MSPPLSQEPHKPDHTAEAGVDADQLPAAEPAKPATAPSAEPAEPAWTVGDEQQELESWPRQRQTGAGSGWYTPTEAAKLLGVSRAQIDHLVYGLGVLKPWLAAGGRMLLRRGDSEMVYRLAGPAGTRRRWEAARLAVGSPTPPSRPARKPRAESRRSQQINALPWPELAEEYRAGITSKAIADRYGLSVRTVWRCLREQGVEMVGHPVRARLPLTDQQLAQRHAAGAAVADLGAECQVSTATIWRHLRTVQTPPRRNAALATRILDHLSDHKGGCTITELVEALYHDAPPTSEPARQAKQNADRHSAVRRAVDNLQTHQLVSIDPAESRIRRSPVRHESLLADTTSRGPRDQAGMARPDLW